MCVNSVCLVSSKCLAKLTLLISYVVTFLLKTLLSSTAPGIYVPPCMYERARMKWHTVPHLALALYGPVQLYNFHSPTSQTNISNLLLTDMKK